MNTIPPEPESVIDEPHALVLFNADEIVEISPFPSYEDALESLRHRASWWEQADDTDLDLTTADLDDLSDLYADGAPGDKIDIIFMDKPIMGPFARDRLALQWPQERGAPHATHPHRAGHHYRGASLAERGRS